MQIVVSELTAGEESDGWTTPLCSKDQYDWLCPWLATITIRGFPSIRFLPCCDSLMISTSLYYSWFLCMAFNVFVACCVTCMSQLFISLQCTTMRTSLLSSHLLPSASCTVWDAVQREGALVSSCSSASGLLYLLRCSTDACLLWTWSGEHYTQHIDCSYMGYIPICSYLWKNSRTPAAQYT